MIKLKELLDKLTQLPRPKREEVSHLLNNFKKEVIKEYDKKLIKSLHKKNIVV